jgi:DNA-binding NarL/FixJ family response regulator
MSEPITVLIVDDHLLVRQGVRAFLETQPDIRVVADAGTAQEAIQLATELVPDVVLMDLVMPGIDGVEATRRLRRISPRSQVLVLDRKRCARRLAERRCCTHVSRHEWFRNCTALVRRRSIRLAT